MPFSGTNECAKSWMFAIGYTDCLNYGTGEIFVCWHLQSLNMDTAYRDAGRDARQYNTPVCMAGNQSKVVTKIFPRVHVRIVSNFPTLGKSVVKHVQTFAEKYGLQVMQVLVKTWCGDLLAFEFFPKKIFTTHKHFAWAGMFFVQYPLVKLMVCMSFPGEVTEPRHLHCDVSSSMSDLRARLAIECIDRNLRNKHRAGYFTAHYFYQNLKHYFGKI